jgi:hypothetical protein
LWGAGIGHAGLDALFVSAFVTSKRERDLTRN